MTETYCCPKCKSEDLCSKSTGWFGEKEHHPAESRCLQCGWVGTTGEAFKAGNETERHEVSPGSFCMESTEAYIARMERGLRWSYEHPHWVFPKAAIEILEANGCVTSKEGKKWAFGGWLHEDIRLPFPTAGSPYNAKV